ncbi:MULTISPECIES: hypothetical protein [Sphingomonas]|uniref:hypothetical protein n=1 Tax=Sphingomonas TaxID=13687 RepID=UPI000F7D7D81|nr:hypothetical protein [Sphingomonas sp. ABOLF]GLK19250.1 hypothetical protein GCM10017606_00760 [Microbacterium terregens]
MAFEFEASGTVSVTEGSVAVSGNGTSWATGYPGVILIIGGLSYPVASIDGRDRLTLVRPFDGPTASGVEYTLAPVQPENYELSKKVNEILDIAGDLIDATVGPAGPEGPPGPEGPRGKDGDAGFGSIVNFTQYSGQPAGGSGVYMIVPVAEGEPGITLTQTAQVILPKDKANAGIGLWIKSTTSGYAITLGLSNAPVPQPDVPGEELDLSGTGTIYIQPNTVYPLGIYLAGSTANFTVAVPKGLPIRIERKSIGITPTSTKWQVNPADDLIRNTGNAVGSDAVMEKKLDTRPGAAFSTRNGHLVIGYGAYLESAPLGIDLPQTADPVFNQVPPSIKLGFKGVCPAGVEKSVFAVVSLYNNGKYQLGPHWSGVLSVEIEGGNGSQTILADESPLYQLGSNHLYEAEYVDDPSGPGGTVTFWVDGQQLGTPKPTERKVRVAPGARLEVNASSGNSAATGGELEIEYVSLGIGRPDVVSTYTDVVDGAISAADLEALVVDARGLSAQPAKVLSYTANGTQKYELSLVVGEMDMPAGRAYKAVLEDWSTGTGVAHPNHLVMTKPGAQNCRFEDPTLYNSQPAWTEVLPQGAVPSINGINYYCEGIRMGTYTQFQFIYDWDTSVMPNNPFGDPEGLDSYMVAHKWLIYDKAGTLLARIEQPNGQPLNSAGMKAVWEGQYDGRGVAMITDDNPHYNFGTTRSSVIWRSHDPEAYSQQDIYNTVPVYDIRVPFACHTSFSVNGGDMRVYGSIGQSNGFANWRIMSYEPTTYEGIQAQVAASQDPWKGLNNLIAATPNAGVFLKYAPFNQMGRSPLTAPGGVRDDRQIMPEPIAHYARDVTSTRAMDGLSNKRITIDYLTGYASDPYYGMENGRCVPVYKGNARRNVGLRRHYYGYGEAARADSASWYGQSGRVYEWAASNSPLRVKTPTYGLTPNRPTYGTNSIDAAHAHQFPHWGSMLFKSPEFAMLGHKLSDQTRLYGNVILATWDDASNYAQREMAWKFGHAALCWKTASRNSPRLYTQAEILDWVVFDFEAFYDQHYASNPGFLNPPTNVFTNGAVDLNKVMYASAARFGIGMMNYLAPGDGCYTHDFMVGYWLQCLHVGERLGFNQALRDASPKAKAVIDWLLASHRKRAIGRTNNPLVNSAQDVDYITPIWTMDQMIAANGDVSKLPQNFAEVATKQTVKAPSWDSFKLPDGTVGSRDGQAMDQLLAAPALLKDMGMSGSDLEQAITLAEQRFQERLTSETAKGPLEAGQTWYKFHQATNNRPYRPGS